MISPEPPLFLSAAWMRVMVASGAIARACPVTLRDTVVHVGEYRAFGLAKWILYGALPDETELLSLFVQARRQGVFQVESDFNMARWQERTFLATHTRVTRPFGTYLVDLSQSEEALWEGMHPKHRNMTRRARQEGVEIRPELDLGACVALMGETYARGGREHGFSLRYLELLRRELDGRVLFWSAVHRGELQAALVLPYDGLTGYYLHGASRTGGVPGASNLLHWEAMRHLRSAGVGRYDLGGARETTDDPRLEGIFRFKQRFGGVFVHCYHWKKVVSLPRERLHALLFALRGGSV
ncbi:MAG: peptidoglycan bridge formation glycyltransferase FemA/FemB family protein [Magnetococcales bacterium]|nr:peptidoglycan bridge formation glycyltransferase FemA/FemB family protein [Magnetococcales bacterium]